MRRASNLVPLVLTSKVFTVLHLSIYIFNFLYNRLRININILYTRKMVSFILNFLGNIYDWGDKVAFSLDYELLPKKQILTLVVYFP